MDVWEGERRRGGRGTSFRALCPPTDVGVVLRGGRVPGLYVVLLAESRDLLVGHGDRYVTLVRQQHDRYRRAVRQRDLLPEIAQPLLHRLKGRHA